LFDPNAEDEDEMEMTNESGALFGLVNLMIRNKLPKELDIPIPLE